MTRPVVRPDVRLDDEPMRPVACGRCAAAVGARKSSWDQTSLQWDAAALAACAERAEHERARGDRPFTTAGGDAFAGCGAIRAAVRAAAVRGDLPVHDTDPPRTRDEEHP